ncbi:MAG: RES domain-containing protein [Cyanobacteriota bacterium]|nr:RES domain-containing protein [Cyanobacteriota bacterium]
MSPWGLGFRVCDRRYPFLWHRVGQPDGRWNRTGDQPVHYLASTPTVAWAEWIRHQEIQESADLAGVAAALWAVLIPADWGHQDLQAVPMSLDQVLDPSAIGQVARLALVDQLKQQGAQGLLAPTAALQRSDAVSPCVRVIEGQACPDLLPVPAHVILLWCNADRLPGWCCVQEGRPDADLLPLVRREGMLAPKLAP